MGIRNGVLACLGLILLAEACQSGNVGKGEGGGGVSPGQNGGGGTVASGGSASGGDVSGGAPSAGGSVVGTSGGDASGGRFTGGAPPAGGGSSSGGSGMSELFQVDVHLASEDDAKAPTTVGIVTWSTSAGTPTKATIQFGLTTDYGMEAPVDVGAANLRTLLLGMKPEKTYHFRVSAEIGGQTLVSDDFTVLTGSAPPEAVVSITKFDVVSEPERERGFIVLSYWNESQHDVAPSGMVFILDSDGDIVWWYDSGIPEGVGRAAMSSDGRDMWMVSAAAVFNKPILRVGMDGLELEVTGSDGSHDIAAVEEDVMAFVWLFAADEVNRLGETRSILPPLDTSGASLPHCNAIAYNKTKSTYVVSNLTEDVYLFPRVGATPENTKRLTSLVGPNTGWGGRQHGVQLLSNNHLILFANDEKVVESGGTSERFSTALEFNLDDGKEVWRYEGGEHSANFGGVQRLPAGNTLVTYSNPGVIHEVTRDKKKVLEITGPESFGYATWRPSLYGPLADAAE